MRECTNAIEARIVEDKLAFIRLALTGEKEQVELVLGRDVQKA